MAQRRAPVRRSKRQWAVRIALALVTVVLAWVSVTFSLAQVLAKGDPARAHLLAPYDGRITAAAALALSGPSATTDDRRQANSLALRALRQDPTAVSALSTLGLNAEVAGDIEEARQLFRSAQKLSRRNTQTQLWMIEDAVRLNNIREALHQYDITLRVLPNLWEILFPVLASASSEPAIRVELTRMLVARPPWGPFFIDYAAGNSSDPRSAARLLNSLRRAGGAVSAKAQVNIVDALIKSGAIDDAWTYYADAGANRDRRRSRNPNFRSYSEAASAFDWIPMESGGLTAVIQDNVFDFSAPASVGGPLLQQLQLLPPGTYRLMGHSIGIEQDPAALPYWTLRCQDGRELGRVEVPNSKVANGNFTGALTVPAGCPVQTLVLTARPSDALSGLSGQISRVALVPVQ